MSVSLIRLKILSAQYHQTARQYSKFPNCARQYEEIALIIDELIATRGSGADPENPVDFDQFHLPPIPE